MIHSSSSTLDTSRRKAGRTLFPRLPNTSKLSLNPQCASDLTSRTLEACHRCGIESTQILPPDYERHPLFDPNQNKSTPKAVLELRQAFAEKERLTLLKQVDFVRRNLIEDGWKAKLTPRAAHPDSAASVDCKSSESVRVMTPKRKAPRDSDRVLDQRTREFVRKEEMKKESLRIKNARKKAEKINSLMTHKWRTEAKRAQKAKMLQRSNSLIEATRRHEEYMDSVLTKTRQKNKKVHEQSVRAQEAIKQQIASRNSVIAQHLEMERKQVAIKERKAERQHREFSKRQRRRFKQHRMAHRRVVHQEKLHCKKQHRNVQQKHRVARQNQEERERKFKMKKMEETKRKEEKSRHARELKAKREEERKQSVLQSIEVVQKRMAEVAEKRTAFRAEMRRRSNMKNSKAGKVMLENERQRRTFEELLTNKEKESEQRIAFYQEQKEEELMLRKELGKLRKQQRGMQVQREKKADEYERSRLERKLKKRDEKLALREETRKRLIAKQRRYNDKQRLLRQELSYQFLHLSEDKITSPVAITKFSSRLTGKTPKLNMQRNKSKKQLNDRMDLKTEEE